MSRPGGIQDKNAKPKECRPHPFYSIPGLFNSHWGPNSSAKPMVGQVSNGNKVPHHPPHRHHLDQLAAHERLKASHKQKFKRSYNKPWHSSDHMRKEKCNFPDFSTKPNYDIKCEFPEFTTKLPEIKRPHSRTKQSHVHKSGKTLSLDDVKKEKFVSKDRKETKKGLEHRSAEAQKLLQPFAKPLAMNTPIWNIVQNTVVAAHPTKYSGYVHVLLGRVSYGNLRLVDYNPEEIQLKNDQIWSDHWEWQIVGGGLPVPILFGRSIDGNVYKNSRDNCWADMKRWGRLWRDRAEDDMVETIDCAFSRIKGVIGVELGQERVKKVVKNSQAEAAGVQVGWRILKVGESLVNPSTVAPALLNIFEYDRDEDTEDGKYTITFAKATPWSQEIKAEFIKKFLSREFWRESILSACTLTTQIFTGYLVTRAIEEYVSSIKEMAFDSGSAIALDFLSRLCFAAKDSVMARTMLSNLDDELHADILNGLVERVKEFFINRIQVYSDEEYPPAIVYLFSRLFGLHPSSKRKFQPGRALNVWFRGVSLDFLQDIQRKIERDWTTEDVKNKYVLAATESTSTMLMADLATSEQRGPASMFISHAWRNRYWELVEACKQHPGQFFFNDIIAIQQHSMKAEEQMEDLTSLPVIISYSACVLLISDMKLEPLRRIWCLYELYHCLVTTGSKLVIEFTSEGLEDESDTGLWDAARDIEKRIANIDVSQASATVPADKERILDEIEEKVPGGINMFNLQLIAALKSEWSKNIRQQWGWRMMETVGRSVRKVAKLEKELANLKGLYANMLIRFDEMESKLQ